MPLMSLLKPRKKLRMVDNIAQDIKKKAFFMGMMVALGGIIFGQFGFSIGILLGTLMSILNFIMLEKKMKIIAASASGSGRNNPTSLFLNYIFRYLLMALALWICINRGLSYFLGAALGLFTIRLGIYYGKSR